MISIIYNVFFIPLALVFKQIYKLFNNKLAVREAKWRETVEKVRSLPQKQHRILFHAASMGEFEQAKPVIELIKKKNPGIQIIVSFFSPSGYENQKNYEYADGVCYLPFDTRSNMAYFIDLIDPDYVVFIRYEIWRNLLITLRRRTIPAILICATKPGSKLLREYPIFSAFTRSNYNLFSKIYTVGDEQSEYFESLQNDASIITLSDTRFDRILEQAEQSKKKKLIPEQLMADRFVLVCGSTWSPDERIILPVIKKIENSGIRKICLIAVPHEPSSERIAEIQEQLPNSVKLSEIEKMHSANEDKQLQEAVGKHIIVDSIGKLLSLYGIADAAYIGGAFGSGVHSVTEPAGYGLPLACGPKISSSCDAVNLHEAGALAVLKDENDFKQWISKLLNNTEYMERAGIKSHDYVYNQKGSSEKISDDILNSLEK